MNCLPFLGHKKWEAVHSRPRGPSLLCAVEHLVQRDAHIVRRGHPVDFEEQGGHGKRHVGEHKQREREQVGKDAPFLRAVNVLPLGDGGGQAHHEERAVHVGEHHDDRPDRHLYLSIRGQEAVAQAAYRDERHVDKQAHEGQQHRRTDDHEHVVGRKPMELADGLEHMASVGEQHLVKALCPTHALLDRGLERDRLFIEELSRRVPDPNAVDGAERRELDILGQRVEIPALHALDELGTHQIPRARHGAGGMADHASVVEIAGLADEPGRISRGDPTAAEILGVAVARKRKIALVERIVHDGDVITGEQVVGVEDEERLVLTGVLAKNSVEPVIHDPALALAREVVALVDDGTRLARGLGGVIRAGVCHHEDVDQLRRIILVLDRFDQVGDDRLLVMGGNEERIGMLLLRRGNLHLAANETDEEENHLIQETDREHQTDDGVEDDNRSQSISRDEGCRPFKCTPLDGPYGIRQDMNMTEAGAPRR